MAITSPEDLHPGRVWTIKQALALLTQGYSVDHVVQVTGYPVLGRRPRRPPDDPT